MCITCLVKLYTYIHIFVNKSVFPVLVHKHLAFLFALCVMYVFVYTAVYVIIVLDCMLNIACCLLVPVRVHEHLAFSYVVVVCVVFVLM